MEANMKALKERDDKIDSLNTMSEYFKSRVATDSAQLVDLKN
jgi:hypothetical protein